MLEYNVRFGDPECQPLMLRLAGDPAAEVLGSRRRRGDFGGARSARSRPSAAACVVLANEGYPGDGRGTWRSDRR